MHLFIHSFFVRLFTYFILFMDTYLFYLWIGVFVFIFEIIRAIADQSSNTTSLLQMCNLWLKLKQRESNF